MSALLMALIDIDAVLDEEFNAWYDTEHVPERLAIPGITAASRWKRISGDTPRYAALFFAESLDVLTSGRYVNMKQAGDTPWTTRMRPHFERVVRGAFTLEKRYGPSAEAPARVLAIALTSVPGELEARYARWYDAEHGPAVSSVPGIVSIERYTRDDDQPHHLTLVHATGTEVFASPAYTAAKESSPGIDLRKRWSRIQGIYRLLAEWT